MMAATPVAGILGALGAMRDRPDSFPLLPTPGGCPALVIVGEDDQITPGIGPRRWRMRSPMARLAVVARCRSPDPPMERPEAATALLSRFLSAGCAAPD